MCDNKILLSIIGHLRPIVFIYSFPIIAVVQQSVIKFIHWPVCWVFSLKW